MSQSTDVLGQRHPHINTPLPGPLSETQIDALSHSECPALTGRRARRTERSGASHDPIVWKHAVGCNVVDLDGNRFVDLSAGFGAAAIGHRHPEVVTAIQQQSQTLLHALGDVHPSPSKIELLTRLCALSPWPHTRAILGLSGADAVEAALKTAKLKTGRPGILAFKGSYHGLSHGPLAACGYREVFRAPFEDQLNPHVLFADYPKATTEGHTGRAEDPFAAIERLWDRCGESLGAILVEPALGRGGIIFPPNDFLPRLATMARARGALLIVDEIFTGLGRCGTQWLSTRHGAEPDMVCTAKALGGGLPISACLAREDTMDAWGGPDQEAIHTSTFNGNPLGCRAAITALDILAEEALADRALDVGTAFIERLQSLRTRHRHVIEVRGRGLMIGIELDRGERALRVLRQLLERGYITLVAGRKSNVISLTPPLTIETALLDRFADTLDALLSQA